MHSYNKKQDKASVDAIKAKKGRIRKLTNVGKTEISYLENQE